MMRAFGIIAIAAGAMAQTAPKIQSVNDNMVVNAVAGDVVFNTDGGATTSISTITAAIDQIPTDRSVAIVTAVNQASVAISTMVSGLVTPLSTTVVNHNAAIGSAQATLNSVSTMVGQISTITSNLQSNAVQYVPSNSPCNAANQGRVRLINEQLQYCVGTTWKFSYHEPLGTSRGSAAPDCQAIADAGDAPTSGIVTAWIEQEAGDGAGDVYQAKCSFSTVGSTTTGVSLGGDGSNPTEPALNCAILNGAAPNGWGKPAGVYWVSMENTMAATDSEDIVQVKCQGGNQVNGDGSDYRAPVTSCAALVTEFGEYLYDAASGQPNRYWQAIAPNMNLALMNPTQPVGPALPSVSSTLNAQAYNAQQGNDGQPDQTGDFVHGASSGETYPTFTLELGGQAQVSRVVLFLRQGTCALRNMLSTGCGGINLNTVYSGQDQGFTVTVGDSPCMPETPCPGTVCGWVRQMTGNQQYTVTCPNTTVGKYVSFQLPGANRMLQLGEMQVYATKAAYPCATTTAFGNGANAANAGLSCRTIKLANPTMPSGVKWIRPDVASPAFQAYCDMVTYGGGWTIGEQWTGAANNGESYPSQGTATYTEVLANGFNHGFFYNRLGARSLGKTKINNIWAVFGVNSIIRWAYSGTNRQNVCQNGLYQRMAVDSTWDLFHAMRDTRGWDNDQDATAGSHWSTQFGINTTTGQTYQNFQYYQEQRADQSANTCRMDGTAGPNYDPARNIIVASSGNNMRFHQWENREIWSNDGRAISVSRHGAPGDPIEGCQWTFCNSCGRSQAWCNQAVSVFLMIK